jgi:hypothetical protein
MLRKHEARARHPLRDAIARDRPVGERSLGCEGLARKLDACGHNPRDTETRKIVLVSGTGWHTSHHPICADLDDTHDARRQQPRS